MKTYLTFLLLVTFFNLNAQLLCTGGGPAASVTFPIGGQGSFDFYDDADNYSASMNAAITGDVVGAEFININIVTAGDSWCSEAIITIADEPGLATTNFIDLGISGNFNGSPCSDLPVSLLIPLNGLVFPTGPAGALYFELWETNDDNPNAVDATYAAGGLVKVYVCPAGQLLPIKLASFDARSHLDNNEIYWTTSSELNNEYQAVMRSPNGNDGWVEIGRIKSRNSSSYQSYTLYDNKPLGTSYYQLKSVDFDGQVDYSKVIVVQNSLKSTSKYTPQITKIDNNQWQIDLYLPITELVKFNVFDITGKLLQNTAQIAYEGENQITLNTSLNATGIYVFEIVSNNLNASQKVVYVRE